MSHFKAKMHRIIFPASVRPFVRSSLRWILTQYGATVADSEVEFKAQFPPDPSRHVTTFSGAKIHGLDRVS